MTATGGDDKASDMPDKGDVPPEPIPPEPIVEQPPAAPPTVDEKKTMEQRLKSIENWMKFSAIIVALIALIAPWFSACATGRSADAAGRSAAAARDSADTAAKALDVANQAKNISDQMRQIAEKTFETAGALVEIDPVIKVSGDCGGAGPQNLTGTITVRNNGRTGTEVSRIQLAHVELGDPVVASPPNKFWMRVRYVPIGERNEIMQVDGGHGLDVQVPLDCAVYQRFRGTDPVTDAIAAIPSGSLVVLWYGPAMGSKSTDVAEIKRG